ncbi:hypothetical protein LIA77_05081 [Sarocladium implicatum]|nr:hypothetical protein LIA77_05081 [Sarocladium implicatum]
MQIPKQWTRIRGVDWTKTQGLACRTVSLGLMLCEPGHLRRWKGCASYMARHSNLNMRTPIQYRCGFLFDDKRKKEEGKRGEEWMEFGWLLWTSTGILDLRPT